MELDIVLGNPQVDALGRRILTVAIEITLRSNDNWSMHEIMDDVLAPLCEHVVNLSVLRRHWILNHIGYFTSQREFFVKNALPQSSESVVVVNRYKSL